MPQHMNCWQNVTSLYNSCHEIKIKHDSVEQLIISILKRHTRHKTNIDPSFISLSSKSGQPGVSGTIRRLRFGRLRRRRRPLHLLRRGTGRRPARRIPLLLLLVLNHAAPCGGEAIAGYMLHPRPLTAATSIQTELQLHQVVLKLKMNTLTKIGRHTRHDRTVRSV